MQCYVRSDSVVSRVIAGETLVVPVRKGVGDLASIYSLNQVASSIWQAIARPCCKDEIVELIVDLQMERPILRVPAVLAALRELQDRRIQERVDHNLNLARVSV